MLYFYVALGLVFVAALVLAVQNSRHTNLYGESSKGPLFWWMFWLAFVLFGTALVVTLVVAVLQGRA